MDINKRDKKNCTPLHWACYSRSENALNYLLSLNPDLEAQDVQGSTPLHLAVKSVEVLMSTRPVRALLLKGANRTSKDNKEKSPTDVISDSLDDHLRYELISILKEPSYFEFFMVKAPLKPLKPSPKT
mmetsp:Transcript_44323/g.43016  ORF Transcript_44323/g.43016 Transcript_44323/m.43016 type:complete len:128 (-) Transcript_44323:135-518(-)